MGILKAPILKLSPSLEFLNYHCDLIVIERIQEDFAQFNDCIVVGECLMCSLTASPLGNNLRKADWSNFVKK